MCWWPLFFKQRNNADEAKQTQHFMRKTRGSRKEQGLKGMTKEWRMGETKGRKRWSKRGTPHPPLHHQEKQLPQSLVSQVKMEKQQEWVFDVEIDKMFCLHLLFSFLPSLVLVDHLSISSSIELSFNSSPFSRSCSLDIKWKNCQVRIRGGTWRAETSKWSTRPSKEEQDATREG